MVGETIEQLKESFADNPPILKIVEAMATRKWRLLCEYWASVRSLVIQLEGNEEHGCRIRYWHPVEYGRSRYSQLPPVKDMVDSYVMSWWFMGRWESHEAGVKNNESALTFKEVMERLDDLFGNDGKKYFQNQGDIVSPEILKMIKQIEEHPSPSPSEKNHLTEKEINQLIKAAGGEEHHFPPPEVSYDRHKNHRALTHAEFWKDWSSWLAACKWEHLSVLIACQEALQKVLKAQAHDVVEEIGRAFSGIDFSNTRWDEESNANLKFQVTNFCQMAYRAYSIGEERLFDDLFDSIDWVFADAEVNFAYMGLCAISKAFYDGTDKENREL